MEQKEFNKYDIWFFIFVVFMGGIASLTSLLASDKPIKARTLTTYLLSGGIASGVVFFLAVEKYNFSYFLLGVCTLAGFKALDVLTIISSWATSTIKRALPSNEEK